VILSQLNLYSPTVGWYSDADTTYQKVQANNLRGQNRQNTEVVELL